MFNLLNALIIKFTLENRKNIRKIIRNYIPTSNLYAAARGGALMYRQSLISGTGCHNLLVVMQNEVQNENAYIANIANIKFGGTFASSANHRQEVGLDLT